VTLPVFCQLCIVSLSEITSHSKSVFTELCNASALHYLAPVIYYLFLLYCMFFLPYAVTVIYVNFCSLLSAFTVIVVFAFYCTVAVAICDSYGDHYKRIRAHP